MNRIYIGSEVSDEKGVTFISAPDLKTAKRITRESQLLYEDTDFCNFRTRLYGKGKTTNIKPGELTVEEIINEGIAWWDCDKCYGINFEYIDDEICKCKKCGSIIEIPYVDC